jgi:hypothetical protein
LQSPFAVLGFVALRNADDTGARSLDVLYALAQVPATTRKHSRLVQTDDKLFCMAWE